MRQMVQDDGHIFCTEEQVQQESADFCRLVKEIYDDMGFRTDLVRRATRPEVRAGSDVVWDKAENAMHAALKVAGLEYDINEGDGAFYGPKIEYYLRDAIGREWQCGTLQCDFVLPERLDASYVGEDGQRHRPVMLHRAILGIFHRFMGIFVEHYAGKFPLWTSPVHAVVCTITNDADDYAETVYHKLVAAGLRAQIDTRSEKINAKIRDHSLMKIPAIFVVGKKEAESGQVAIRRLDGKAQEIVSLDETIANLIQEATPPDILRKNK
jgi:threonyl-tRNA synthetase